jgi:hypothetical protein
MSLRVFHPGTRLLYQEAFSEADCEFTHKHSETLLQRGGDVRVGVTKRPKRKPQKGSPQVSSYLETCRDRYVFR